MASVTVHLDEDCRAVLPGGTIRGEVTWTGATSVQALWVSLLWYTSGKGTEDIEVVTTRTFEIEGGADGAQRFEVEAPRDPWSFSGRLVTLTWAIEASLEPRSAVDRVTVVIAPDRAEIAL